MSLRLMPALACTGWRNRQSWNESYPGQANRAQRLYEQQMAHVLEVLQAAHMQTTLEEPVIEK